MSSGGEDQNNNTTLLQGSRLLYKTQDGNESVGLNSYLDPSTNAVMGLVIFNELNDPPNQTRISINNQGITETFANGDPSINVSWENFYLLKQATPALRIPDASNVFTVCNTYEANDNNLAKTKIARMSADPSANPLVSLNIVATGETATLTQNGLTYLPTTAGTPSTRTWADIIASSGSSNTLDQVLTNGNTATGASATIGLTNSGVGGLANPSLVLTNSNATINTNPTIELNKTGRNLVGGETVGSISMYGLDATAQKTEFARIQVKTENVAGGNEDGTLSIYNSVNGAILETFNFNGSQNEINSFRPLDMNGNAVRTSLTNLTLDALSSTGTGDVIITPKTNLRVGKTMLTNDKIQNLNSASASSVDFASSPFNKFEITKDKVELNWNDGGSNQSQLILQNDLASLNNSISQYYQSASGNIQTILQSVPSVHRFQQLDGINNRTSELSPAELELINTSQGTTAFLNNNLGSYQNEFYLSANDTTTPLYTQAKISNTPLNQYLTLVNNSSGTSNSKTLTLINETSVSPSLSWVNNIDSIPFNITSNQDLNIGATGNLDITTATGSLDISSAIDVNIIANTGSVNITTGNSLSMAINNDWLLTGGLIISGSASGNSGQHLRIFINGTPYKIQLLND